MSILGSVFTYLSLTNIAVFISDFVNKHLFDSTYDALPAQEVDCLLGPADDVDLIKPILHYHQE